MPTKWCCPFEPYDFGDRKDRDETSSDCSNCGTWVRFNFERPIWFSGFGIRIANDDPDRDPMFWKVVSRDVDAMKHRFQEERYTVERFDMAERANDVPRYSVIKFCMRESLWTDQVTFRFSMNRGNDENFQIGKIYFYS